MNIKNFSRTLFVVLLFISLRAPAGVLLQGFYWDAPSDPNNQWWNRLSSMSEEIGAAGFTAIWLPPALKGASGGYSNGYDPYDDYDLGSKDQKSTIPTRWGTKTSLVNAVASLRARGLEVYLDMIVSHRGGDDGYVNFVYRDALGGNNGRFAKSATDFDYEDAAFGRSLNHNVPYVREGLKQAGQWQVETLGTQGMRIDYAKSIPPEYLPDYLSNGALRSQFAAVEYWDESIDVLQNYISRAQGRVSAFDFALWGKLRAMAMGEGLFNMRNLVRAGLVGRDPSRAITFVENHDTDRSHKTINGKHLGYAYILTQEGYPSVFWRDFFDYGMKDTLKNLIWIHEVLASGSTEYRFADDDLLVYERQGGAKLLVGLNDNKASLRKEWVKTNFGSFVRLRDYTGHYKDIETNGDGWALIEVPPFSYVAYAPANFSGGIHRNSYPVTQVFRGADDLDIAAANGDYFTTIESFNLIRGQKLNWWLNAEAGGVEGAELQAISPSGKVIRIHSSKKNPNPHGDFTAEEDGYYRFEVLIRAKGQRVPFKWTANYFGRK